MGTFDTARATASARTAMFGLLIVTLTAGLLVPVYSDEVGWRFQLSRSLLDGGVDRSIIGNCGANTTAVPPFFMWPIRTFSSGVTVLVGTPLGVRLAGVAFAILAVLLLRAVIGRLAPDPERRTRMELVAWSVLGLGVLPFLLVWSRPEQPLWLALLVASLAAYSRQGANGARAAGRLLVIVAATLAAFCYHPKAVLYLPVFVAAAALAGWRRRAALAIALGVMGAAAWSAFGYWSHRFACPDDPVVAAHLARENAAVLLVRSAHIGFGELLPRMAWAVLPTEYIRSASPAGRYLADWLPVVYPDLLWGWTLACRVCWWVLMALGAVSAMTAVRDPSRSCSRLIVAGTLIGTLIIWAGLQFNKNAYEDALYLPVVVLAVMLAWSASARNERWWNIVPWLLALTSVGSQTLLLSGYVPRLWTAARAGGYVADQPISFSAFRYPQARIVAAGARCGLQPRAGLSRVLIDDLTYFAYRRTSRPYYYSGVLANWNGSITDPAAWLHTHGSPGAVVGCQYLPPAMRASAIRTGAFCCVNTG